MKYFTVAEVAELFRVSPEFVRQQTQTKRWPHKRLGPRKIVFSETQIAEIDSLTDESVRPSDVSNRARAHRVTELLRRVS